MISAIHDTEFDTKLLATEKFKVKANEMRMAA